MTIRLAIIAATLLTACSAAETSTAPAPASSETIAKAVEKSPVLRTGNAEVSVTSVEIKAAVGRDSFARRASDGGEFAVVGYRLKNIGSEPMTYDAQPDWQLVSPKGVRLGEDADAVTALMVSASDSEDVHPVADINPGLSVEGWTVFQVAKGTLDPTTWAFSAKDEAQLASLVSAPIR